MAHLGNLTYRQVPSGTEGLGELFQALGQMAQQKKYAQDVQRLQDYQKDLAVHNQMGQGAFPSSNVAAPQFTPQSRAMQGMMGQGMLQNMMLANQPISPAQQMGFDVAREGQQATADYRNRGPARTIPYYTKDGKLQQARVDNVTENNFYDFLDKIDGTLADPKEEARKVAIEQSRVDKESRDIEDRRTGLAQDAIEEKRAAEKHVEVQKDLAYRELLEDKELDGTITQPEQAELQRFRVPGAPTTKIDISTGNSQQTAAADAQMLDDFQVQADKWNAANPDSHYRREIKVSATSGKRSLTPVKKSETEIATMNAFKDITRRAKRARALWKPGFTGMVEGSDIARVFKEKTGLMAPGEVEWRQNQDSLITKLYTEAGKQLSDNEIKIHMKRFPRSDVHDDVYERQINEFTRNLQEDIASRQRGAGQVRISRSLARSTIRGQLLTLVVQ